MKTLLPQLKKALSNRKKFNILLKAAYEKPLAWRIINNYFNYHIYFPENEIVGFFKHAGIKTKCVSDVAVFVKENLVHFQYLNKHMIRHSIVSFEKKFIRLQYLLKTALSPKVKYPSYYDVFMEADVEDIEWIVYILLGQWTMETGVTEQLIDKVNMEVSKMEYKEDAVVTISMMNKHTNQIVGMDMLVSKETLNMIMKDKVHKEFDKILKETVDKLSTVNNINKLLYS